MEPVFPKEFVKNHCPKVTEARDWRKIYNVPGLTDEDDVAFGECAFRPAGCGMECESCEEFLAGVHMTPVEAKFLPMIRQYYADMEKWEKQQKKEEKIQFGLGAGI
jgi:hypothetical protein